MDDSFRYFRQQLDELLLRQEELEDLVRIVQFGDFIRFASKGNLLKIGSKTIQLPRPKTVWYWSRAEYCRKFIPFIDHSTDFTFKPGQKYRINQKCPRRIDQKICLCIGYYRGLPWFLIEDELGASQWESQSNEKLHQILIPL